MVTLFYVCVGTELLSTSSMVETQASKIKGPFLTFGLDYRGRVHEVSVGFIGNMNWKQCTCFESRLNKDRI